MPPAMISARPLGVLTRCCSAAAATSVSSAPLPCSESISTDVALAISASVCAGLVASRASTSVTSFLTCASMGGVVAIRQSAATAPNWTSARCTSCQGSGRYCLGSGHRFDSDWRRRVSVGEEDEGANVVARL
eukprot:scaffold39483_cov36-Phaeocystis_antarctica.AAC.2